MTKRAILFAVALCLFITSCIQNGTDTADLNVQLIDAIESNSYVDGLESLKLPESTDYQSIPQDPNNPLSKEKIELGKLLFHETALGRSAKMKEGIGSYSCASCHHSAVGFQAGSAQGIGDGGVGFGIRGEGRIANSNYSLQDIDVQPLRSPSVLNSAYQEVMLWNGQFGATGINVGTENEWSEGTPKETNMLGYQGVEIQAIAGLKVHRMTLDESFVVENPEYRELFDNAFTNFPAEERYSNETAGLAIAAYERTVLANQSPFQNWLHNRTNTLTIGEIRGAILFFGKGECAECHNGPALNSMSFHALGMKDLESNKGMIHGLDDSVIKGRGGFTKRNEDNYKFKTPQLYSLQDSPFYGHGSSFESIQQVIRYKNRGLKENMLTPDQAISTSFRPLGLTESEISDLTQFIETGLHDNNLKRYLPLSLFSGQCFPNNDVISKRDLGCG
jgi:cytochrome c peroxidase